MNVTPLLKALFTRKPFPPAGKLAALLAAACCCSLLAAWTPAEIAWVDQNLEGFRGRATRDEWVAQARVLGWISAHPAPPDDPGSDPVWRADVTGRRLLRWLYHSGQILPGLSRDQAQPFFDSLHAQLDFLNRVEASAGLPRIEALTGAAIAAMLLKGAEGQAAPALTALGAAVDPSIRQGVLRGRCPETLLICLSLLGWTKAHAAEAVDKVASGAL